MRRRADGRPASIRGRLAGALTVWSLVLGLAVSAAVWLSTVEEVDELLDDALQESSGMIALLVHAQDELAGTARGGGRLPVESFAWQVVAADGALLMRSTLAPSLPWHRTAVDGFSDLPQWRVYGIALDAGGRMLYVAQTEKERKEARGDVALSGALAALAIGLLGHVWLRLRVREELQPLKHLSERLATLDGGSSEAAPTTLGPAERSELEPVHRAIDDLTARLTARLANEQAFTAHAAHALRTPLAGIDAQLAVALREAPASMRERLQRVRDAATRLQSVVAALLGLFRAGRTLQPADLDLAELMARMPVPRLAVEVAPGTRVRADADLLAAALLNLLDNAQRHGASRAWVEPLAQGGLRVRDDGPGVLPAKRERLQAAIDDQRYEGATGLGLMMADRVARAHGGRLHLAPAATGFAVELRFDAAPGAAAGA